MLELCRDYLLLIANQDLDRDIQRKLGASDLVQESMLTAQAQFDRFEGESKQDLLAWLRGILINDVKHWRRHYKGVQKRGVQREFDAGGSQQIPTATTDPLYTPSTRAAADEEEAILKQAMDSLPENYQDVIRLRNWEDHTFIQIGKKLDCSAEAARKLWSRAIVRLQDVLKKHWPELDPDLPSKDP